jgi:hypothetical protein
VARTRFGAAAMLVALGILLFGVFAAVVAASCGVLTQVLPDPNFGYNTYVLPVARQAFAAVVAVIVGTIGAIVRIAQANLGLIFAGGSLNAQQLEYSAATGIAVTASVLPLLLSLVLLGGLILWNWTRRNIHSPESGTATAAV